MAAAAGASGARAWLQTHHFAWLTPRRLRAATVAVFAVAAGVSAVGLSGSSAPATRPAGGHVALIGHSQTR
jgi:hypothetical protein